MESSPFSRLPASPSPPPCPPLEKSLPLPLLATTPSSGSPHNSIPPVPGSASTAAKIDENRSHSPDPLQNKRAAIAELQPLFRSGVDLPRSCLDVFDALPFIMPGGRSQTPNSRIRAPEWRPDAIPVAKRPRTAAGLEKVAGPSSSSSGSHARRPGPSSSSLSQRSPSRETDADRMLRLGIPSPQETNVIARHVTNNASIHAGSHPDSFFSPPESSSFPGGIGHIFNNGGPDPSETQLSRPVPRIGFKASGGFGLTPLASGSPLASLPYMSLPRSPTPSDTSVQLEAIESIKKKVEAPRPRFLSLSASPIPLAPRLSPSPDCGPSTKTRSITSRSGSATLPDQGSPQPRTRNGTPYPHSETEDNVESKYQDHGKNLNAAESNAEAGTTFVAKPRHLINSNTDSSEDSMPAYLDEVTTESKAATAEGTSSGFNTPPRHPSRNLCHVQDSLEESSEDNDDFPMGSDQDEGAFSENGMSDVDSEMSGMSGSISSDEDGEDSPMESDEDADGSSNSDEAADGSSEDFEDDGNSSMGFDEDAGDWEQGDEDESDIGVHNSSGIGFSMECDCRTCRWERGDWVSDSMDENDSETDDENDDENDNKNDHENDDENDDENEDEGSNENNDDHGKNTARNHTLPQLRVDIAMADGEVAVPATSPPPRDDMSPASDDAVGLKNPPDVGPGPGGPTNKGIMALLTTLNENTLAQAASQATFITTVNEQLKELSGAVKRLSERQEAEAATAEQLRAKVNKIGAAQEKLATLADGIGAGSQKVAAAADTIKKVNAKLRVFDNIGGQVDGMDEAILRVEQQITALGMFLTGKVVRNTGSVASNGLQLHFDALHNRLNNQDEAIASIDEVGCECDCEDAVGAIGDVETRLAAIEDAIGAGVNPHPNSVCGRLKATEARMEANFKY